MRGATEGLRAGDGADDWSSVLGRGSLGGFDFWEESAALAADVDSLRGAVDGLLAGSDAVESVCLTVGFGALAGAREGFRSGVASGALAGGTDALRGAADGLRAAEGAGDSAGLVAGVEALLGARDGLRSGAASLGLAAGVEFLLVG